MSAELLNDHRAGVDADAYLQSDGMVASHVFAKSGDPRDDLERGVDRAPSVVLVRSWIAEIDENSITEVSRDGALETGGRVGDDLVICAQHRREVFRVKALGEARRVDEIAEHDGELAALSIRLALSRGSASRTLGPLVMR
jgi:hypothetical protein